LATLGKGIIKTEELPGLELRFGELGKRFQSAIPPSIGTDAKAREWNKVHYIARLPEYSIYLICSHDSLKARPESKTRKTRTDRKFKRNSELSPESRDSDERGISAGGFASLLEPLRPWN
jgi:hypothetical protein